jgi:hypothetical protein
MKNIEGSFMRRKDLDPRGNLAYKEPRATAIREHFMRNLRDTLEDLSTVFLYAVRNLLSSLRPSPLTDQERREISELVKREKAKLANVPGYDTEQLYAKFVQPMVDEHPELAKMFSKKSFHL